MPYATGIATSIVVFAVGAVLDFAVTVRSNAVNWGTVGIILMAVGAVGFVTAVALTFTLDRPGTYRRSRRVVRDSDGTYVDERGSY